MVYYNDTFTGRNYKRTSLSIRFPDEGAPAAGMFDHLSVPGALEMFLPLALSDDDSITDGAVKRFRLDSGRSTCKGQRFWNIFLRLTF